MEYEIVQNVSLAEKEKEEVSATEEKDVKEEIKPSVVIGEEATAKEEKPVEETPVEETPVEESPSIETTEEAAPEVAPIDIGAILGDSASTEENTAEPTVEIPVPEVENTSEIAQEVVPEVSAVDYTNYNEPYTSPYEFNNNINYDAPVYDNQSYQADNNSYSFETNNISALTENVLSFDSEESINAYYDRKIADDTERTNKEREAALISYREKKDMEAWIAETENRFTYRPNRPRNYTDSNISQGYNMAA